MAQYLTAVSVAWRGRGLAKALKARLIDLVREHQLHAKWVGTYNAKSNAPMLAINRRMGYATMREIGTYQMRLAQLQARLGVQ